MTSRLFPKAGIGLKPEHYQDVLLVPPSCGLWVEVHPENYMTEGGPRRGFLAAIREHLPLSMHGVGLSLAGDEPLDLGHLEKWRMLIDEFEPAQISEHVAWSARDGVYFADLLPTPATHEALNRLAANIDRMQTALKRTILIENPALYINLKGDMTEPDFLTEVCRRTGCGLLLDVNNAYVCERNVGRSATGYLDAIPADLIGEIHLAGHAPDPEHGEALLIDNHGAPICDEVWGLYERLIARIGPRPTLIERDANIPPFEELAAEAAHAERVLAHVEQQSMIDA